MRVAVIGGTGFVGRHVVDELAAAGHDVVAVARRPRTAWHSGFREADARRTESIERVLVGCDAAVWAAGSLQQSVGQSHVDIHVKAVKNLVAACRATRVRRVVLLSALGARGGSRSPLHRAKFAGEDAARRSLLDVTVLRPSVVFGPGDHFVVPLARLLRAMPLGLFPGRGAACLSPVGAADVARAVAGALARDQTIGAAFDLPGPETLRITAIYERVMEAIGRRRPLAPVPYLLLEPLMQFVPSLPWVPFSFDQLAILEEEPRAEPGSAADALGLDGMARFTVEAIRKIVAR